MGDNVEIEQIEYLYANSERPLWQIDLKISHTNGSASYQRLFIEPNELENLLRQAKLKGGAE